MEISNDRRETVTNEVLPKYTNYVITFTVGNNIGKGCALARGLTPNDAMTQLKSSGLYNADPSLYNITSCQEVNDSITSLLLAEQILENS